MNTLVKADAFFFITAIAIIIVTIFLAIAFVYIIKTLRNAAYISRKAKDEADLIVGDINAARANLKEHGKHASGIVDYFLSFFPKKQRRTTTKK